MVEYKVGDDVGYEGGDEVGDEVKDKAGAEVGNEVGYEAGYGQFKLQISPSSIYLWAFTIIYHYQIVYLMTIKM